MDFQARIIPGYDRVPANTLSDCLWRRQAAEHHVAAFASVNLFSLSRDSSHSCLSISRGKLFEACRLFSEMFSSVIDSLLSRHGFCFGLILIVCICGATFGVDLSDLFRADCAWIALASIVSYSLLSISKSVMGWFGPVGLNPAAL